MIKELIRSNNSWLWWSTNFRRDEINFFEGIPESKRKEIYEIAKKIKIIFYYTNYGNLWEDVKVEDPLFYRTYYSTIEFARCGESFAMPSTKQVMFIVAKIMNRMGMLNIENNEDDEKYISYFQYYISDKQIILKILEAKDDELKVDVSINGKKIINNKTAVPCIRNKRHYLQIANNYFLSCPCWEYIYGRLKEKGALQKDNAL